MLRYKHIPTYRYRYHSWLPVPALAVVFPARDRGVGVLTVHLQSFNRHHKYAMGRRVSPPPHGPRQLSGYRHILRPLVFMPVFVLELGSAEIIKKSSLSLGLDIIADFTLVFSKHMDLGSFPI